MPSRPRAPSRVLIVDDQRAFAQSLQVVLEAQDDVDWVEVAGTGEDAIDLAREQRPDVVVMDIELPGIDGVEATGRLRELDPDLRVVVLTGIPDAAVLARVASAGACAFLLKNSSVEEILDGIRDASPHDEVEVDAAAIRELAQNGEDTLPGTADRLTQRELEVLGLLAEGRQPKEIARTMGIALTTCRGYVKSLLAKLGAHSALEAVVIANRTGLISLPTGEAGGRGIG